MKALKKQGGVSFGGFIMILVLIVVVVIFGLKLIPAYIENAKVQKTLEAIVQDPAMQTASLTEIKDAFYKRATTMDDVRVVSQNDLDISKDAAGRLVISAAYNTKIPMFGNVSLLIEFNPHAPK
jgi:hypothetical protein